MFLFKNEDSNNFTVFIKFLQLFQFDIHVI